ncbi:hypothetical protein [Nonomuraea sp. NPDC050540]|uniref:hypothetical protein n=1 Tax=Nonomuraea sp. NPDC050540 TaxID=3364367 RepID=UPI0037B3847E
MPESTPIPGTDTPPPDAPAVPSPALSVEEIIEQARTTRRRNADDIAHRLARGEQLSAERLYDTLHSQKVGGWWLMIDRHIRYSPIGRGLTPAKAVAKYVSWISPYLEDNAPCDPVCTFDALELKSVQELALAHLDRALALIRQDAARTFLEQAGSLAPASSAEHKQSPSGSAGQEATA